MAWDRYPEVKWVGHPAGFWIGGIGYLTALLVVGKLLPQIDAPAGAKLAIGALLTLVPLLLVSHGLLRMIRHKDELYQRIQVEAMAYAVGIVVVASLVMGVLEGLHLMPHINAMWAGQALMFVWGIAAGILACRYK